MEVLRLASLLRAHGLSTRQLAQIAPYAPRARRAAGDRVLLDGPLNQQLVLVGAGRGRVRCAGEIVGELLPGEAFGPLAPRRTAYRTASVTATRDLRLVAFSTRDMRALRETAPDAAAALLAGREPRAGEPRAGEPRAGEPPAAALAHAVAA